MKLKFGSNALIFEGALVYLVLRSVNLLGLPIFNDEAIYLHWGQIFTENPEF